MSRSRTFTVGRAPGFRFHYQADGGLVALPDETGAVQVIGGQDDLGGDIRPDADWTPQKDATGNNAQISDGQELYAGAGFGDPLIDGQVDDVLWALGDRADRPGRLLELGCGPGFLLESLARRLPGWTVVGVDPSTASVAQARDRGLDVRQGFLDDADLEPGFDAVVVMGNLQLHPDLRATLTGLAALAAPGAVLFADSKNPATALRRLASHAVGLPGLGRVRAVHAVAAHAFHGLRTCPSKTGLSRLLEETGWEVVGLRTTPPRLLRFGNTHALAHGVKGRVWRVLDRWDERHDERAWIQVAARRVVSP